jgi:hypothetical protein
MSAFLSPRALGTDMLKWLFGGEAPPPQKPPGNDPPKSDGASGDRPSKPADPLNGVRSVGDAGPKLDPYDPLVFERISEAAKQLQSSGMLSFLL